MNQKGWETRRKNGTDHHTEEAKEKIRLKSKGQKRTEVVKKGWETRRKNGTDKRTEESYKLGWKTRRKNKLEKGIKKE